MDNGKKVSIYQKCKQNGICVRCHSKQAESGSLYCEACHKKKNAYGRQYDRENYDYFKKKGICVACKVEKAERGQTLCIWCLLKKRDNQKPDCRYRTDYQCEQYKRNKANGICVCCRTKKATKGVFCLECHIKHYKREEARRRKQGRVPRWMLGDGEHCSTCGKPVEENGDKLCKRCLDNSRRTIKIAFESGGYKTSEFYKKAMGKALWKKD